MSDMLRSVLGCAVPLWVMDLRRLPWPEIEKIAHESAQIVAEKGDVLQFGSKKKGEAAAAFNALAKGLAALSFCPGGVTFLGDHYENQYGHSPSSSST
jgi:hypothetical protein